MTENLRTEEYYDNLNLYSFNTGNWISNDGNIELYREYLILYKFSSNECPGVYCLVFSHRNEKRKMKKLLHGVFLLT